MDRRARVNYVAVLPSPRGVRTPNDGKRKNYAFGRVDDHCRIGMKWSTLRWADTVNDSMPVLLGLRYVF